jgi:hypothetical protein
MDWNDPTFWDGLEKRLGDHKFDVIMIDEGSASWFLINGHERQEVKVAKTEQLALRIIGLMGIVLSKTGVVILEFKKYTSNIEDGSEFLCSLNYYMNQYFNSIGHIYLNLSTVHFFIYGNVTDIEASIIRDKTDINTESYRKVLKTKQLFCNHLSMNLDQFPKKETNLNLREFVRQRIL